jgi:hypothetical protein
MQFFALALFSNEIFALELPALAFSDSGRNFLA